jgi:hypothetical protein
LVTFIYLDESKQNKGFDISKHFRNIFMKNYSFETIQSKLDELGISKAELGRMLGGIDGQRIGQYLANTRKPKADFWEKWDKTFNETNVSRETNDVPFYDAVGS